MKRPVLVLLLLSLIYALSEDRAGAQLWKMRRYEAVAGIGPSFFFGDVGGFSKSENILGFRDLTFLQTRYNLNFSAKYRIFEDVNIRLSLSGAVLRATDTRGSNQGRDLGSKISIFEPALIGEFYFIKNKIERSYLFSKGQGGFGRLMSSLDFYVFTGAGAASFSVTGNENLIDKAMDTGGLTAVIPVGIGSTMIYSPDFNFGIEIGGRYSFSDYLDGYTSQYSSSNDVYYFLNFTFTYKLRTGSNGWPLFR